MGYLLPDDNLKGWLRGGVASGWLGEDEGEGENKGVGE